MKKVNVYLMLCLSLFFISTNCRGAYRIELDEPMRSFFEQKIERYMKCTDSEWAIRVLNREKDLGKARMIGRMGGFIGHNDRDLIDCCEICYFVKRLSDDRIKLSESEMQIILKALTTLGIWFYRSEVGEIEKMFEDYDFSRLFVFEEKSDVCYPCVIL